MGGGKSRRLDWPDCCNTRDLGGLPRQGGATRSGVLVRSDSTTNLTPIGLEAMRTYGVRLVVDLRTAAELVRTPNPVATAGSPSYVNVPLIDDPLMHRLDAAADGLQRYLMILDERSRSFQAVFELLAKTEGPVVVHCAAGKDRTALVAAMMLDLAGVPDESIGEDFAESEAMLAGRFEEWISAAPLERRAAMRADLRCPPARIVAALDHLRSGWGGVGGYLEAAGVSTRDLNRLSSKLT
ncbi:MAG TPA: tyrosine-protein phosphatase [Candidatus Dormibacteraeota bacterium]|nr:tyrosine-protein phosphatase [Candidatus Dormibacteraeota bacterium]